MNGNRILIFASHIINELLRHIVYFLDTKCFPDIFCYYFIATFRYISTMKQEEDYEEFMENIVNKNNSAHVNAYNAIKFLLFGKKLKQKKSLLNQPTSSKVRNNSLEPNQSRSSLEKGKDIQVGNYGKKGKKKFKDIRDFEEKKKEKEGKEI